MSPDRLREVARNLFESSKAGDDRTLGEKAIGVLAFQQLCGRCDVVSRTASSPDSWVLHLERGKAIATLERERRRARQEPGTTVYLSDLDPEVLRVLTQRRVVDYLRSRRGAALANRDYEIEVVEGRASELVLPDKPEGVRLSIPTRQTLWGRVEFVLYVAPGHGRRRRVSVVGRAGTSILDDLSELEEFSGPPWDSDQVSGRIVFESLQQTAGRRAILRDRAAFPLFVEAVKAIEPAVAQTIERVAREVDAATADRLVGRDPSNLRTACSRSSRTSTTRCGPPPGSRPGPAEVSAPGTAETNGARSPRPGEPAPPDLGQLLPPPSDPVPPAQVRTPGRRAGPGTAVFRPSCRTRTQGTPGVGSILKSVSSSSTTPIPTTSWSRTRNRCCSTTWPRSSPRSTSCTTTLGQNPRRSARSWYECSSGFGATSRSVRPERRHGGHGVGTPTRPACRAAVAALEAATRETGLQHVESTAVTVPVQVTFDCADPHAMARFWAAALGLREGGPLRAGREPAPRRGDFSPRTRSWKTGRGNSPTSRPAVTRPDTDRGSSSSVSRSRRPRRTGCTSTCTSDRSATRPRPTAWKGLGARRLWYSDDRGAK